MLSLNANAPIIAGAVNLLNAPVNMYNSCQMRQKTPHFRFRSRSPGCISSSRPSWPFTITSSRGIRASASPTTSTALGSCTSTTCKRRTRADICAKSIPSLPKRNTDIYMSSVSRYKQEIPIPRRSHTSNSVLEYGIKNTSHIIDIDSTMRANVEERQ